MPLFLAGKQVGPAAVPLAADAKGEKPADLPVQQVTKVETDINLTGCQSVRRHPRCYVPMPSSERPL